MGMLASFVNSLDEKAKEKAKNTLLPKSGWMSRKLWIFAGIALTLVWLGRGNLVVILDGIIFLTAVYLVTQVIQDLGDAFATAWVKREQLRSQAAVDIERMKHAPVLTGTVTTTTSP